MAADRERLELAAVEELLRRGPSDVVDMAPPDSVWMGVELEARRDSRRPRRRAAILVAVAAAVLLVAVPLGLAARSGDRTETASSPTSQPDAAADLLPLDGYEDARGWAALTGRQLAIGTEDLLPLGVGETYELWLLALSSDDGTTEPLWVGTVGTGDSFNVDSSADLDRYTTVDISIEPDDGDPAHSGRSVLRGALDPSS